MPNNSAPFHFSKRAPYYISLSSVFLVAIVSFSLKEWIGYQIVALLLLVTVSLLAMLFDILPVLIAAVLSALLWNFFFIPPIFTFHISNGEDLLLFFMYFVIALVHTILTFKIREQEKKGRAQEKKENAIKLYNTLFNSLSHELRTPIATIIGAVDTLKDQRQYLSEAHQNVLLDEIDNASMRLNRQVENLLNMSRLESGILQPQLMWCDMNEIIFTAIETHEWQGGQQIIHFAHHETLPLVKLDPGFMTPIINNIIGNAIQHTSPDTQITVACTVENDVCTLTIADTGTGFPADTIPFVFDKFYRLPHSKAGGTGLGLSIAKGYVQAQNGTISLSNNENGGATFVIRLPTDTTYINHLKNE